MTPRDRRLCDLYALLVALTGVLIVAAGMWWA